MKIKIDKADQLFSQYIRLRDMECKRCYSLVTLNDKGIPNSHQCSHYFGRGKEATRFDEENADTLCWPCHHLWGGEERAEYKKFKIKQLGLKGFEDLRFRSEQYMKKDRAVQVVIWKARLEEFK